jgi:hypothetical protein
MRLGALPWPWSVLAKLTWLNQNCSCQAQGPVEPWQLGCWPRLQSLLGKALGYYCHESMGWVTTQMMRRLFFLFSPFPSSWIVHCCLDSCSVSSHSLAASTLYTSMDCYYTILLLITWHGPGQPGLAHITLLPLLALLYWPLQPGSLWT